MIRIVRLRFSDPVSLILAVSATVALAMACLGAGSAASTIPDRLLTQIRGANPGWTQVSEGNCSVINVYTANNQNPPPPPGTGPYVTYGGCPSAPPGAACILCAKATSYTPQNQQNVPNPINYQRAKVVNCNGNNAGSIGTCQDPGNGVLQCLDPKPYQCDTTGAVYQPQAQGN